MSKLTFMCGLPESGKTTKAAALAAETGATLIRHDTYYARVIHPETVVSHAHLAQVRQIVIGDIRDALGRGEDVVYDGVNLNAAHRSELASVGAETGADVVCVFMDTPLDVCLARDHVGWARIFADGAQYPTTDEGFELIICHDGYEEDAT